jgi:hypothetical protein
VARCDYDSGDRDNEQEETGRLRKVAMPATPLLHLLLERFNWGRRRDRSGQKISCGAF